MFLWLFFLIFSCSVHAMEVSGDSNETLCVTYDFLTTSIIASHTEKFYGNIICTTMTRDLKRKTTELIAEIHYAQKGKDPEPWPISYKVRLKLSMKMRKFHAGMYGGKKEKFD